MKSDSRRNDHTPTLVGTPIKENIMTKTAEDYRIHDIRRMKVDGRQSKVFTAYVRNGQSYVFCGHFSAPARTPNKELWKFADASRKGGF